jgi:tetratricopeptide (TPR) repeat protein
MDDDTRTQRWGRIDDTRTQRWGRIAAHELDSDPLHALREAIAAVSEAPQDREARQRLRALGSEQGAPEQLVRLLGDEIQAVRDPRVAAAFYEELADVHENLDQPLETITAMEALVAIAPGEVDHIDRLAWLYRRAGAWQKAAAAFEHVAGLATDGRAHAAARAAARLYHDHGQVDRAVAMYRAIVARRPDDADSWRALDELLERLEHWRELADVRGALAQLAPTAVDRAVLLRSQARALEHAGEDTAAAELVTRAACEAPEELSGVVDYAQVLAREGKPRAAADVLAARIAEASSDGTPPDRLAALRTRLAGMLEACGEPIAATTVLEQVLEIASTDRGAKDRLVQHARSYREARDYVTSARLLERVIELAGDDAQVARELDDVRAALAVDRARTRADQLPPEAAAEHLRATLAELDDATPPEQLAKLVHRYARAVAVLGDHEHAHQLVVEAHHLARRDLEITLALGESCFARKLWREAAIHLGSLADHPLAPQHASAVAAGLVRAAQAQTRALRPANAPGHYEAAVRIDPRCGPAWHALAELALERGDTVRAEHCWMQAADAGDPSVLRKLLAIQRSRDAPERGVTCERLAELEPDPRAKKELAEEALGVYAAAGDLARGRAIARRLIAAHPLDPSVVASASAVGLAAGDHEAVASWLAHALSSWDSAGQRGDGDPRRAELWRRLGDAEHERGEKRAATIAYQRAVALAPESEGALAARRGLVSLAAAAGRPAGESLAALVEAEQHPADVLAYARELAAASRSDDARAMFELARALGARLEPDEVPTPARAMAADEAYATALADTERRALIDDPADRPLGELLELLGEAAALICPDPRTALEHAGLADARRLGATSTAAVVAMLPQVANALTGPPTLLFASDHAPNQLTPLLSWPPVLVIGPAHLAAPADPELRFALGRVVELARPCRLFASGQAGASFARLVAALAHAFGHARVDDPAITDDADRLRSHLSVQLRRRLSDAFAQLAPALDGSDARLDPTAYVMACRRAADRSGLVASGAVAIAIDAAGGRNAARHVVALAAAPRYRTARARLTARGRSQPPRR